jgi:thioredoxin 1
MPVSVTKENFDKEISQSKQPVVIDVFATWCGPCQQMMPIVADLEKDLGSKYKFVKINVDEARDLSIQYGVTSVPTFIFVIDNQVKGRATGYMNKQDLQNKIQEALG